jgi:RNA polymerase sigma factor (sigma-70 family)
MSDSIGDYLNSIGKIPLLTAAEEIELGNAIQKMIALADKEILSKEDKRIIRAGERAKRRMIQGNLRLVIRVAARYNRMVSRISMLDLIQEGNIGLIRAVELFDPSRGYKFSTYAFWWIKQGIMRASQAQDRIIKLPSGASDVLRKVRTYMVHYREENGRLPTIEQCADYVGMLPDTIRTYLDNADDARSLDIRASGKDDQGSQIVDLIPSDTTGPEEDLLLDTQIRAVETAFVQLRPRFQRILTLKYGLNGDSPISPTAIAKQEGVSRESMRRQIKTAEEELKEILEGKSPGKLQIHMTCSSLTWGWS